MNEIDRLIEFLKPLRSGRIKDQPNQNPFKPGTVLERLLFECWHEFEGGDEEKMEGYKILNRLEKPFWEPPILRFQMERHGATCCGSIWADIQKWELNIETKRAHCETIGRRQIHPMDSRLNVKPIAETVGYLIINGETHEWLIWAKDGTVRIQTGRIIPATVQQTTIGRRRRFRKALIEFLSDKGWEEVKANKFKKIKIIPMKGGEFAGLKASVKLKRPR